MNSIKDLGRGATRAVADFITSVSYGALPDDVRNKCRELLLDALACGLAGSRTPLGKSVFSVVDLIGGSPQAALWGTKKKSSCTLAAYHNASAINALDYDDTAEIGHPGATTIPVSWALAEWKHLDGAALMEAMVAGYETSVRVAGAVMPSVSRYAQIHGIGTPQTFGAVAAASKLLQLDRDQILNALGIAGATAPVAHAGKFGWTDKGINFVKDNAAVPAEIGLRAALLAQAGYQGSESILEGETGFWVMAGSDRCDFDQLQDFSRYRIIEVSLKPYPCCRWLHTTLDVLRELRENRAFNVDDVDRVVVRSIPALAGQFQRRTPYNFIDVQFSVPLSVSLLLLEADFTSWWRVENHCRPEVLELAARVEVYSSDEFQNRFEALGRRSACIPTRVEVILKNGVMLDGYAEEARGLPTKPMSGQERLLKFDGLTRTFLSKKLRDRLKKEVQSLNESSKINQLTDIIMDVK